MNQAAENLASLVTDQGASALVRNLETEMHTRRVGPWMVPASLNSGQAKTCYINCPSRAFIDYGAEELDRLTSNPAARLGGRAVLRGLAPLVRATGLDRQVQLNNWLVATNILPPATSDDWITALETAGADHPGFIPVVRSVNRAMHQRLLDDLIGADLTPFPMRKVFIRDYARERRWTTDEQRDARLLARDDLEQRSGTTFSTEEFDRAANLYGQLYLDKYSTLNPQYSGLFLRLAQACLGLTLVGLFDREKGMVGVIGRYEQHDVLTGPIVGYDRTLPRATGLYRRLRAINHAAARNGHRLYHMSAGAEGFKRLRGGRATVEYMIADFRHAPQAQRRAARILSSLTQRAARRLLTDS